MKNEFLVLGDFFFAAVNSSLASLINGCNKNRTRNPKSNTKNSKDKSMLELNETPIEKAFDILILFDRLALCVCLLPDYFQPISHINTLQVFKFLSHHIECFSQQMYLFILFILQLCCSKILKITYIIQK